MFRTNLRSVIRVLHSDWKRLIAAIAKHVAASYHLAGKLGLKITRSVNVDAYSQFRVIGALDPD
jgi:hypothetical protein